MALYYYVTLLNVWHYQRPQGSLKYPRTEGLVPKAYRGSPVTFVHLCCASFLFVNSHCTRQYFAFVFLISIHKCLDYILNQKELDPSFRQLIREVSMPPPSLNSGAIPFEVLFSEPFLLVTLTQTAIWVRHTTQVLVIILSPLRKLEFHRRFKIILENFMENT